MSNLKAFTVKKGCVEIFLSFNLGMASPQQMVEPSHEKT